MDLQLKRKLEDTFLMLKFVKIPSKTRTSEWVAHCNRNTIILLTLSPHSSHLTQPLSVGSLKKHMMVEIDPLIHLGIARIQKTEWSTAFEVAHENLLALKIYSTGFVVNEFIHLSRPNSLIASHH